MSESSIQRQDNLSDVEEGESASVAETTSRMISPREATDSTTSPNNNADEPAATTNGEKVFSQKNKTTNSQKNVDNERSTTSQVQSNDNNTNSTVSSLMNSNSSTVTNDFGKKNSFSVENGSGEKTSKNDKNNEKNNQNGNNNGNNNGHNIQNNDNGNEKSEGEINSKNAKKIAFSCVSFVLEEDESNSGYAPNEVLQHNMRRRQQRFPGKEFKVLVSAVWSSVKNNNNNVSAWNTFNDYTDSIVDEIIKIGGTFNVIDADIISMELDKARKTIIVQCSTEAVMNKYTSRVFKKEDSNSDGVSTIIARATCAQQTDGKRKTQYTVLVPASLNGGITVDTEATIIKEMESMMQEKLGLELKVMATGYHQRKNQRLMSASVYGFEIEHDKAINRKLPAVFGITVNGSKLEIRAGFYLSAAKQNKKPKISLLSKSFETQFSNRTDMLKTELPKLRPSTTTVEQRKSKTPSAMAHTSSSTSTSKTTPPMSTPSTPTKIIDVDTMTVLQSGAASPRQPPGAKRLLSSESLPLAPLAQPPKQRLPPPRISAAMAPPAASSALAVSRTTPPPLNREQARSSATASTSRRDVSLQPSTTTARLAVIRPTNKSLLSSANTNGTNNIGNSLSKFSPPNTRMRSASQKGKSSAGYSNSKTTQ